MRRNRRRGAFSKEKIVMAASTVLVLGTLTVTGLWLGARNNKQDDGYVVDLSTIEEDMTTGLSEKEDIQFADNVTQDAATQNAPTDDLDYDPYFQETNSGNVENPDTSGNQYGKQRRKERKCNRDRKRGKQRSGSIVYGHAAGTELHGRGYTGMADFGKYSGEFQHGSDDLFPYTGSV